MKDTLIIIQCCKSKCSSELYPDESFDLGKMIPETNLLLNETISVNKEVGIIDVTSPRVTSLSLYRGYFYSVPGVKDSIVHQIKSGTLDFLIMSAGYGFVHPFQRIHKYELEMTSRISTGWRRRGLPRVLEEYIKNQQIKRVYGFFSKTGHYQKIFKDVRWGILRSVEEAGYYYLDGITKQARRKVPETLGKLLLFQIDNDFKECPIIFENASVIYSGLRARRPKCRMELTPSPSAP